MLLQRENDFHSQRIYVARTIGHDPHMQFMLPRPQQQLFSQKFHRDPPPFVLSLFLPWPLFLLCCDQEVATSSDPCNTCTSPVSCELQSLPGHSRHVDEGHRRRLVQEPRVAVFCTHEERLLAEGCNTLVCVASHTWPASTLARRVSRPLL